MRQALDSIKVDGTAIIVDGGENKNLELSARNLKGVELMRSFEIHPYHLLRYDAAVFSRSSLERLQDSLKKSAPKRKAQAEGVA
jgi:large subunit ribosomal protein L4